jgi:Protein of unknown function (DUF2489)
MEPLITSREAECRIAVIAESMAGGTVDLLEGCRQVLALRTLLSDESLTDEDLGVLIAVESELDDMPSDRERSRWAVQALAELDQKKVDYLREAGPELVRACRSLALRWG